MTATTACDIEFPCSLTIHLPLPTHRLASSALRALQVDAELSPLVRRSFSLASANAANGLAVNGIDTLLSGRGHTTDSSVDEESQTILRMVYEATTNRMLRVAVNGFMESLGVVLGVMEELDVDVLAEPRARTETTV